MRFKSPSSRGFFRVRFSIFDIFWAAMSPPLALFVRDAPILSADGAATAVLYCGISFAFSLIAFLAFRLSDGMSRHFSVYDAFNVIKAVLAAGLMTSIVLFTLTRLDGIPRSTPFLTVLILASGLLIGRTMMLVFDQREQEFEPNDTTKVDYIIMIGSTQLSSLYIKFLRAYCPYRRRVTAVLDHQSKLIGRAICGVPVIAPPQQLDSVIEEFCVHGVPTNRVVIGGDEKLLSEQLLAGIRAICERRQIALEFVPKLMGLSELQSAQAMPSPVLVRPRRRHTDLLAYFRSKRFIDFFGALLAILVLSPLFVMVSLLVLLDVGSPVLFWQQRMGQHGRNFLVHKFRTLRAPFDWQGQPAAEDQRLSWAGRFLRKLRLDELPQLFNVLVGDMSLIGPRPLLPHDQPANADLRLSVRPGITGWAQVHGGSLVPPDEKGALDEWYIRHASLWLDFRILLSTLGFLITGERPSEDAVRAARAVQQVDNRAANVTLRPESAAAGNQSLIMRMQAGAAASHDRRRTGTV
jgi:lipopolysaccharide/colanic/teichoic acid biosynthesis glycosyltransferase